MNIYTLLGGNSMNDMNNNEPPYLTAFAKAFDQAIDKVLPEKPTPPKKRTPIEIDLDIEKSIRDKKKEYLATHPDLRKND